MKIARIKTEAQTAWMDAQTPACLKLDLLVRLLPTDLCAFLFVGTELELLERTAMMEEC